MAPRTTLRNIALTVHELEEGEFYWVLLEAADDRPGQKEDAMAYQPLEAAAEPQGSYTNALVAGVGALRRLFGPNGPR